MRRNHIDGEEARWAKMMEGKTPAEREQVMAETLQNAKDQFAAMVQARAGRKQAKGRRTVICWL